MDNTKNNQYYIDKILTDLKFVIDHTQGKTQQQIEGDDLLVDSIMFRVIQIAENSMKLDEEFQKKNSHIPWRAIRGMRNMIVHNYGAVDLAIVYDTVANSIPELYRMLSSVTF
ncbi:MAG: DUF86 domain-containing protein [Clostridiales bacterium]|nr:DUF86 domain-containing protein [Clostridiales bacterium]